MMASFDRDSFDTLSSIGSDCSSLRESLCSSQGSYDETKTVDTLEADIILWEAQAALHAQDSIIWPPNQSDTNSDLYWASFGDQEGNTEGNDETVNTLVVEQELHILQTTSCKLIYRGPKQNIYLNESPFFECVGHTVKAKALSMEEYLELRKESWYDDYIQILITDENLYDERSEELQAEEAARHTHVIGLSDKVIKAYQSKRYRKERSRKFVYKTENKNGRLVEAPKQISKKPYPTWRKKKTGRAHKEALVPRDKDQHLKEVFEVCNIEYPKNAPWNSELESNKEEATVKLWMGPPILMTYGGKSQLWL